MKKLLMTILCMIVCLIVAQPIEAYAGPAFDGRSLDVGIYWYGKNDVCEKDIPGVKNRFFDPNKPTVILMHGWQKNSTPDLFRVSFNSANNLPDLCLDVNYADYWIDRGWNIGIYYWNQFGDESEVKDAEAKIYGNTSKVKMRWRKVDGSYEDYSGKEKSVSEVFLNDYSRVMKNFKGSEIRIVGHSLGIELAMNATNLIEKEIENGKMDKRLRPDRVALLDPFWSKGAKDYLNNKWPGEVGREQVEYLKGKGIAFEMYKTSRLPELLLGDNNDEIKQMVAYEELYPNFVTVTEQMIKHSYCKEWYFYTMAFPIESLKGVNALSAVTDTNIVRNVMGQGYYYKQSDGARTVTPEDDEFKKAYF